MTEFTNAFMYGIVYLFDPLLYEYGDLQTAVSLIKTLHQLHQIKHALNVSAFVQISYVIWKWQFK